MTIFYVAKTGSDSNDCTAAQNPNTPKLTLNSAIGCLSANNGDIIIMSAGIYQEAHDPPNLGSNDFPGATGWAGAATVKAAMGETVILQSPANVPAGVHFYFENYAIFDHIIFDGTNSTSGQNGIKITRNAHHLRLVDCVVRNFQRSGIHISNSGDATPKSDGNEFIRCEITNNGLEGAGHGAYCETSDNLWENCNIHHEQKYGIQINLGKPNNQNNTVRYCRFTSNGQDGGGRGGLIITSGAGHKIYNCIFEDNDADGFSIRDDNVWVGKDVNGNPGEIWIYNCTSVANGDSGFRIDSTSGDPADIIVRNCIAWDNIEQINDNTSGITLSNNLTLSDPLFVNYVSRDLHLQSNSPAKDMGIDLSASIPALDYIGVGRPQSAAWDIGAYEFLEAAMLRLAYRIS